MLSPFAAANIAISANHLLWVVLGPIIVWSTPWSWPDWVFPALVFGPLVAIDLALWPLVYFAAKRDGWDPVSRTYRRGAVVLSDAG